MFSRETVVKLLKQKGFENQGGAKHEKWVSPAGKSICLPRNHKNGRGRMMFKRLIKEIEND